MTAPVPSVQNAIREFIETDPFFKRFKLKGFADDLALIDRGVLDSIGIFNLIVFIEKAFSITVSIEELDESNFLNLSRITKFVELKMTGKHGGL